VEAIFSGDSSSELGELKWSVHAEFDGFLIYDFELTPVTNATAELIELRVPIKKDCAVLYDKNTNERGFLPRGWEPFIRRLTELLVDRDGRLRGMRWYGAYRR